MDACSENTMATGDKAEAGTTMSRKEKRKLLKKEKRKQLRKEIAVREKEANEARLNDSEEQSMLRQLEQEELDRMERDRREFEERERRFLEELELNRKREQEEYKQEQERERERQKLAEEYRAKQVEDENPKEMDEGSDWEYAEEGPAEIIWQGNEIIVKKKRVRVPKKNLEQQNKNKDVVRPISNPLAPQSEAFEDCKSAQQILDTVAQQVPNFGTEQDKAHCPFHLKTGACRFGTRCSRVHFYPDKSCTLLMKNMYGGPGLTWEQDEGLELHTDEETERSFEEFYEDVHTEFLKFGVIVNFKVCRNGSPHLRGNVYVHYKSLESAVLAYQSTNGRYFAGKQVVCEFVNLTRWKVAICGEYMRSRLKTCSRGSTCNFIHCFRNPCGDYEWADWDRPPPRYWINKMTALFGYEDGYDKLLDEVSPDKARSAAKSIRTDADRRRYSRSRSRELDSRHSASYYYYDDDNDYRKSKGRQWRHMGQERENSLKRERNEVKMHGKDNHYIRGTSPNVYSDDDQSDKELRRINHEGQYAHKKGCRRSQWRSIDRNSKSNSDSDISVKEGRHRYREDYRSHRSKRHSNGKSTESDSDKERSVKDGSERYHEDRTSSRQKTKDSLKIDYERDSREETHQNDPEGRYHEDNIRKHHKYRSKSTKLQDDDLDFCSLDSHGDTMVNNEEGYDVKRRRSSRWSNSELDWPGHDSAGDGFDRNENEYWRHRKESSNTETVSKKSDLSEHFDGSHRDKHGKRESSKHKKRERRPPKSERRSSRHRRKDRAGSNVTLSQKEEASERTHKHRKESAWDQSKVEGQLVTSHEGHHEREACEERFEDAEFDEGNGTFDQKPMDGEKIGDGNFSRQEDSVVLEFVNEQACRRAALEKLQEKQLQKQPTPITSSHNVEGSVTISKVHEDHNDVEAEPRKRRRI